MGLTLAATNGAATLLWILAVILVIAGIVTLIRGRLVYRSSRSAP
ncbi:MAG TPA: GPGG-motif small membrane protein [Actinomycetota bacterium]